MKGSVYFVLLLLFIVSCESGEIQVKSDRKFTADESVREFLIEEAKKFAEDPPFYDVEGYFADGTIGLTDSELDFSLQYDFVYCRRSNAEYQFDDETKTSNEILILGKTINNDFAIIILMDKQMEGYMNGSFIKFPKYRAIFDKYGASVCDAISVIINEEDIIKTGDRIKIRFSNLEAFCLTGNNNNYISIDGFATCL
ncbi:MAG TPA: hypothetical protein PKL31_08295 [Fulvivirga sp.]|nr:hypothetical protein [Fulvivirga sp.]